MKSTRWCTFVQSGMSLKTLKLKFVTIFVSNIKTGWVLEKHRLIFTRADKLMEEGVSNCFYR